MKTGTLLDSTTAHALQAAWLYAALSPVSEFGARAYAEIVPFRPGEEQQAQEHARGIAALAQALPQNEIDVMREALRASADPLPAMSRAAMGDVLEDMQMLELLRFLDAAQCVAPDLVRGPVREVVQALGRGRAGKFGFYLSEAFDSALAHARERADSAQAEYEGARGRLAERAANALGRDEITGGEFIVMRDTAPAIPHGVRVVREAPTYYLCELELDESALQALRRRDEANDAVAAQEQRVRSALSELIRRRTPDLQELLASISLLDVRLAQARFTQQYACVPATVTRECAVRFDRARYLPLEAELAAQGRGYDPISINLDDVAVLTGPNMGGKSVALRTCGFVAALVALGVPVPARSVECALFDDVAWLGIGAQEEAGALLSSFAHEVVRLNEILSRRASKMLILADEFARTTTPHEAKALLIALIRGLRRRGYLAFVATHLAGVARAADVRHFAVRGLRGVPARNAGGLAASLEALSKSMDYSVTEVDQAQQPQGDAIALAHLLGMDDDLVAEAGMLLHDESNASWTR